MTRRRFAVNLHEQKKVAILIGAIVINLKELGYGG